MMKKLTNNQVLLNEYIKQEYSENPEYKDREDDFFEFFASSQVLKDFALSDEKIENGICNESLDGGCDAIYLFADGMLQNENEMPDEVFRLYIQLGGNDKIAKGPDFVVSLKTKLRNLLSEEKEAEHAGSV